MTTELHFSSRKLGSRGQLRLRVSQPETEPTCRPEPGALPTTQRAAFSFPQCVRVCHCSLGTLPAKRSTVCAKRHTDFPRLFSGDMLPFSSSLA